MDATRVAELKSALKTRLDLIEEGTSNPDVVKVDGENVEISTKDANTIRNAMAEAKEIEGLLRAEVYGKAIREWMDAPADESKAIEHAALGQMFSGMQMAQMKDLGSAFVESDEFKRLKESGGYTMEKPFELDTFDIARKGWMQQKDVYGSLAAHNVSMGIGTVVQFDPTVPRGQRTARVRDLFPAAATSANLIDYFKVTGFAENSGAGNAATVADYSAGNFGLKPKSTLQFTSDQAPVRTIAHWEAAHRNTLADEPQLQSTINNELLYGLALEEDDQILNGDGTGENLRGLLVTPNIQTYTQAASPETKADALRRSITKAVLAYFPPTGFVLHPNDWEDIELQKAASSTGGNDLQYALFANVSVGLGQSIWRLPVVESPAMPEGTWLTGAFGTGAQLYDRARASVRIAEQHSDFFVRNAIAILVEERIALAVKRPESFVKGTFIS